MTGIADEKRLAFAKRTVAEMNVDNHENLVSIFEKTVEKFANRTAFNCLGQDFSFAEIDKKSAAFAAWLVNSTGLQKGDRVAIQLPNLIQYPVAAWGILRAGLVLVNTNPLYTQRELEHQFNDSGAKAVVMLADFLGNAESVIPNTGIEKVIVTNVFDMLEAQPAPEFTLPAGVEVFTLPEVIASGEGQEFARPSNTMDDLAVLQYTGGTTGVAKGAMLTHGNLFAYTKQAEASIAEDPRKSADEVECLIAPLPIYHVFGFTLYLVSNFVQGGISVLIPDPRNLDGMMDVMASYKFTGFAAVNTMLVGMLRSPKFDTVDWSYNKGTIAGGAALVPEVAREWQKRTNSNVYEGYGLSETAAALTVNTPSFNRLGTVGRAMAGQEIKLIDDAGNEVTQGEPGELVVRGGQVMHGYWKRPEATEEAIDEDGFFRTGDVAVLQEGGYYQIVDRLKDMILVSGFNVYPNEIEAVVHEHQDVIEAAVVGEPDEKTGEAVCLYAVSSNEHLTEADLREHCRAHLTGYKIPKYVRFMDELPKSNVGKILRRELRNK